MEARDDGRSVGELFADLTRQMTTLVRQEAELARTEITANVSHAVRDAALLAAGGAIVYAGLLALAATAIIALATAGVPAWLSALLVAAVLLIAGGLLIRQGLVALRTRDLAPRRTIETLKEDAELARGRSR